MANSGLPLMLVSLKPDGSGATVYVAEPAINMTLRERELMKETLPGAVDRGFQRVDKANEPRAATDQSAEAAAPSEPPPAISSKPPPAKKAVKEVVSRL